MSATFKTLVSGCVASLCANIFALDVISINFNSADGRAVEGSAGLVEVGGWNNVTGANGEGIALSCWDGTQAVQCNASLRYSSSTGWAWDDAQDPFLKGYLDDGGNQAQITVENIPFSSYDVIVYAATDTSERKFRPVAVNGTYFAGSAEEGVFGYCKPVRTGSRNNNEMTWGLSHGMVAEYGKNALRVNGVTGTLTIRGGIGSGGGPRGCIAAIQIVDNSTFSHSFGYEAMDNAYPLVFREAVDAAWSNLTNWYCYAEKTTSSGTEPIWIPSEKNDKVPGVPNSDTWEATLLDGALFGNAIQAGEDGYKVVNAGEIEGWSTKIGVANNVHLKIATLRKIQVEDNDRTFWDVDATSKITVEDYGDGPNNGRHEIRCLAENGIVFKDDCNVSFHYSLGRRGSLSYEKGLSGTHTIESVELDLGDRTKTGVAVRSRKLVGFGSSTATFVMADRAIAAAASDGTAVAVSESAAMNQVGMYTLETRADGYYINYVAYGDGEAVAAQKVSPQGDATLSELGLNAGAAAIAEITLEDGATLHIDGSMAFAVVSVVSTGSVTVVADPSALAAIGVVDFVAVEGNAEMVVKASKDNLFPQVAATLSHVDTMVYELVSSSSATAETPDAVETVLAVPADVTYRISGFFAFSGANTVAADGILEIVSGTTEFNLATRGLSGTLKIAAGATFRNGTNDGPNYHGSPVLDVAGRLEITGDIRWSLPSSASTTIREGAYLSGVGGAGGLNYAFDYYQGGRILVEGNAEIAANVGSHDGNEIVFEIAAEKTLALSGNFGAGSLKTEGQGTLVLSGTNAYSGTTTVGAGTVLEIASPGALSPAAIVCNGTMVVKANVDYAGSGMTGDGIVVVEQGSVFGIGTARPSVGIELRDGAKISLRLASNAEVVELKATGITADDIIVRNAAGDIVTNVDLTGNGDGTYSVKLGLPTWSEGADSNFATAVNWSTGALPESGDIIVVAEGETTEIGLSGNYEFGTLSLRGEGVVSFTGSGTATFENVIVPAGVEFVRNANVAVTDSYTILDGGNLVVDAGEASIEEGALIAGAGSVATKGTVRFTADNTFLGGLTVKSGMLSSALAGGYGGTNAAVTVEDGGALDLANTKDCCYSLTIAGKGVASTAADGSVVYSGAVMNSGEAIGDGFRQTYKISLAADALVVADNAWGLINSGYSATTLELNGHTFTKSGAAEFYLANTTAGEGRIVVDEGTLRFVHRTSALNCELVVAGNGSVDFGQPVSGVTALKFKPGNSGVGISGIANLALAENAQVVMDASNIDPSALPVGKTLTLLSDSGSALTAGFFTSMDLGGRFAEPLVDSSTVTATVKELAPFIHYDFDTAPLSVDNSKASDSPFKFDFWGDIDGDRAKQSVASKNGRASLMYYVNDGDRAVPYWNGVSARKSPAHAGVMTVTSVIKPMSADKKYIIWGLGGIHSAPNTGIALAIEGEDSLSLIKFSRTTPTVLATVTGIKNLVGSYHFVAAEFTESGTSLTVDGIKADSSLVAPFDYGQMGQLGSVHGALPTGYFRQANAGVYFDDFAVYDSRLTDGELAAMRRRMCPAPFLVIIR